MSPEVIRGWVTELLAAGASIERVAYLFELTPWELEQILDGDDARWLATQTPGYRARLLARARTRLAGLEREAAHALRAMVPPDHLVELIARRGGEVGMSLADALDAGLVTEAEIELALSLRHADGGAQSEVAPW